MTDPHERDEADLRTTPVDPVDILARTIYGEVAESPCAARRPSLPW